MATLNQFKKLREIEADINKNLFLISAGVTVIVMVMVFVEFFTRGIFPATQVSFFYVGVLVLYSIHKEMVRWLGKRKIERQGELFVYGWIALATMLYVINFLTKDYFSYSLQGEHLTTLREVSIITLEVLIIFLLTRSLKILKIFLRPSPPNNENQPKT